MKKKTEQKLSLGKIKIASLSNTSQQAIQGGSTGCVTMLNTCICPPQSNRYAICYTKICQIGW